MSKFWKGFCPSWKSCKGQKDHNKTTEDMEEADTGTGTRTATMEFRFEIPREDIVFDTNDLCSVSESTNIYKGLIRRHPENTVCVIKTCRQIDSTREILSELKILAEMGDHINVVKLIGACTQDIRQGSVFVALEFYQHGNMKNYIGENKQCFHNELIPRKCPCPFDRSRSESPYVTLPWDPRFCTSLLVQWAQGICAGMSFIGSKNVIHNDLAIRNILLDKDLTVKITNFGSAQQLLENYGTDSILNDAPIPWKWVAPEIALSHTVSLKSDIWSYGITLWEIFSLGEEPYGDQSFSSEFFQELNTNGCSLGQPEFANPEMYEIMKLCWTIDPASRPSFEDIQESLRNLTWPGKPDKCIDSCIHG